MSSIHYNPSDRLGLILPSNSTAQEAPRITQIAGRLFKICSIAHKDVWNISKLSRKILPEISDYSLSAKHKILNYLHENELLAFRDKEELSRLVNEIEAMKITLDKRIREHINHGIKVTNESLKLMIKYTIDINAHPEKKLRAVIFNELMKHNPIKAKSMPPSLGERANLARSILDDLIERLSRVRSKPLISPAQICQIAVPVLQEANLPLRSKYMILCKLEEEGLLLETEIRVMSPLLEWVEKTPKRLKAAASEMKSEGTLTESAVCEFILKELQKNSFSLKIQALALNELIKKNIGPLFQVDQKRQIFTHCLLDYFTKRNYLFADQANVLKDLDVQGFFAEGDLLAYSAALHIFEELKQKISQDYANLKKSDNQSIRDEMAASIVEKRIPRRRIPLMLSVFVQNKLMTDELAADILTKAECYFLLRDDVLKYRERLYEVGSRRGFSLEEMKCKLHYFVIDGLDSINPSETYKKVIISRLSSEI